MESSLLVLVLSSPVRVLGGVGLTRLSYARTEQSLPRIRSPSVQMKVGVAVRGWGVRAPVCSGLCETGPSSEWTISHQGT